MWRAESDGQADQGSRRFATGGLGCQNAPVLGRHHQVVDGTELGLSAARMVAEADGLLHLRSRRAYPGRQFAPIAETQLFPALLDVARRLATPCDRPVVAVSEVVGLFGIADLVALVVNPERLQARAAAAVGPILNHADASILAAVVSSRGRVIEEVRQRSGLPEPLIQRRLPMLRRVGAISVDARGRITRHPAMVPLGRAHAIEGKVRDWRRGIQQAGTYQLWADTATLVLGQAPADPEDAVALSKRRGIGLAVEKQFLSKPQLRPRSAGRRLSTSEHVWAAIAPYFQM
jgi:hypothetical protein